MTIDDCGLTIASEVTRDWLERRRSLISGSGDSSTSWSMALAISCGIPDVILNRQSAIVNSDAVPVSDLFGAGPVLVADGRGGDRVG